MRISDWSSDVCSSDLGLATRPGKVLAALVATMIGALSMAISSVVVNEATGFPPSEFPYTVAFLAPLTAGYILVFSTIIRSEEHTSELQSLMRISYAVFCLKKKKNITQLPSTANETTT